MIYRIEILRGAIKQLETLPKKDYYSIKSKILQLAKNPRPKQCRKLKGRSGFRIRQGNYRIIYDIYDDKLLIHVIRVGHRKDVYKK